MSLLVRSEVDACETTATTKYSSRCTRDTKENLTTKLEGLLVSSGQNSDVSRAVRYDESVAFRYKIFTRTMEPLGYILSPRRRKTKRNL